MNKTYSPTFVTGQLEGATVLKRGQEGEEAKLTITLMTKAHGGQVDL